MQISIDTTVKREELKLQLNTIEQQLQLLMERISTKRALKVAILKKLDYIDQLESTASTVDIGTV